ncbi:TetR/AcrR family transcriptional regulator [Fimbriiglobus ruber]|uniref:Transcriptional regulator, TetR family n=1 Tax=Fimbriiglobus ruber TaxID=1908690 RepID=A0A225DLB3_9BACT|nr:TetR/AcrR family transcriptional regulator [Fimbriiglobus ruber]OWK41773.1 Transcriptional regulator, TetR family [Fimbriiglobus ruber]
MKVSREQAAKNRERILDVAAKLFREQGFQETGVDALMKSAGLTHGGFYGHFASKDDLMAEICSRTLARSRERWEALVERGGDAPLSAVAAHYLSHTHRDNPGDGCLVSALGTEAGRGSEAVRHAFTNGLRGLVEILERHTPAESDAAARSEALNIMASLVGAVVLARAVDDRALSDEILAAVMRSLPAES